PDRRHATGPACGMAPGASARHVAAFVDYTAGEPQLPGTAGLLDSHTLKVVGRRRHRGPGLARLGGAPGAARRGTARHSGARRRIYGVGTTDGTGAAPVRTVVFRR